MKEGRLREIPGVGEAISSKITELLTTSRLEAYEKLRAEFPEGIINLMTIPGVGPKTALRLSKELVSPMPTSWKRRFWREGSFFVPSGGEDC